MPNFIAGIDIDSNSIKVTIIETTFRGYNVVSCHEVPIPSPEEFESIPLPGISNLSTPTDDFPVQSDAENAENSEVQENESTPVPPYIYGLAKLMSDTNISFGEAAVAMPGNKVSHHIIELPFSDRKKIDIIIANEVENYVPFNVDEMVLSYQIIEKMDNSSKVLVCLVKKEDVAELLEHLSYAGLDPAIVDVSTNALYSSAELTLPEDSGQCLIISIGLDETDLLFTNNKIIAGMRTLAIGSGDLLVKDDKYQLTPLIRKLQQTVRGLRINSKFNLEKIFLSGPLSTDKDAMEQIAGILEVSVEPLEPFLAEFPKTIEPDDRTNALFAKSLGLGLRLTPAFREPKINLRKGEYSYRHGNGFLPGQIKKFAAFGAVLLMLIMVNVVYASIQSSREAEQLRQQIIKVFNNSFPGQRVVNPVEQFKQNMELVNKKYKLAGYLGNGDLRAIDILQEISRTIPKTVKIDVKKLDIQQDKISIEGITDNFEQVDKIEAALKKFKGFKAIKKDSATRTANEAIKFKFSIKLTDKEESGMQMKKNFLGGS